MTTDFEDKKFLKKSSLIDPNLDHDEDDSDSGESGSTTGKPLVDPSLFGDTNHYLLNLLREVEKHFGNVPITKEPKDRSKVSGEMSTPGPKHPLFDTQQFAGIADDNNPTKEDNSEARELYNELKPAPAPAARPTSTPPQLRPV